MEYDRTLVTLIVAAAAIFLLRRILRSNTSTGCDCETSCKNVTPSSKKTQS